MLVLCAGTTASCCRHWRKTASCCHHGCRSAKVILCVFFFFLCVNMPQVHGTNYKVSGFVQSVFTNTIWLYIIIIVLMIKIVYFRQLTKGAWIEVTFQKGKRKETFTGKVNIFFIFFSFIVLGLQLSTSRHRAAVDAISHVLEWVVNVDLLWKLKTIYKVIKIVRFVTDPWCRRQWWRWSKVPPIPRGLFHMARCGRCGLGQQHPSDPNSGPPTDLNQRPVLFWLNVKEEEYQWNKKNATLKLVFVIYFT